MKTLFRAFALPVTLILVMAAAFSSCDDDTSTIGASVMPGGDGMIVSQATFSVLTQSVQVDSVYANTNACYLGRILDPETNAETTCDFLAQFSVLDNFKLPQKDLMMQNEMGNVVADSCQLRVFIAAYKGDSLAPMKLTVQELDSTRVMEENEKYYSNIDPQKYVSRDGGVKKTLVYSIRDLALGDSALNSSRYYMNIKVNLPSEYAQRLINSYYLRPEYFRDSYSFIHYVCPGFYFKTEGGIGVMSEVDVSTLDLFFRYKTKKSSASTENDTIVDGYVRMGATEEVLQNTHVGTTELANLAADESCTFLKTPAGIFTEVTLPIAETVAGEHYNDTINNATVSFRRINNQVESRFKLDTPPTLLMVRKGDWAHFFEENKLPDSKTSYIAEFSSTDNAYTFDNISRLVSYCKVMRDLGAGVQPDDTEAERNAKYAVWEVANPDWNKVVLVPVKADYSTTVSNAGITSKKLVRVRNEMGIYSTRLLRGTSEGDVRMSVVYSKFSK